MTLKNQAWWSKATPTTITLNDLIPTNIANDIKYLCDYTCEGEYSNYEEWLEVNDDNPDGHIYQSAERIRKWINKEVPF